MNKPLQPRHTISVITPSYEQGAFIEQNIRSVMEQNIPGLEHIIIDGGSKDGTVSILKKYHGSVIWISEKDTGQTNAINKGLRLATGDIITFLNSDDYYLPNALAPVLRTFADSSIDWVSGDYVIVNEKDEQIQKFIIWFKRAMRRLNNAHLPYIFNYFIQPSTFWRRSLFLKAGYFNETYNFAFDYDYWIRLGNYARPFFIDGKISAFKIHPQSKGSKSFIRQFDEEIEVLINNKADKKYIFLHQLSNSLIKGIYHLIKS
jgi:glycosyltransferase involved in cell wall biosynthesis